MLCSPTVVKDRDFLGVAPESPINPRSHWPMISRELFVVVGVCDLIFQPGRSQKVVFDPCSLDTGQLGITLRSWSHGHSWAVQGERLEQVFAGRAELSGRSIEEEKAAGMENQAVKSFTDPADIGALAVFLSGPHARTISGQQFPIDGDSKAAQ